MNGVPRRAPRRIFAKQLAHTLFSLIRDCDAAVDVHTRPAADSYVPFTILLTVVRCPASVQADGFGYAFGCGWIIGDFDQGMYVHDGVLCVEAARAQASHACRVRGRGRGGRVEEERDGDGALRA